MAIRVSLSRGRPVVTISKDPRWFAYESFGDNQRATFVESLRKFVKPDRHGTISGCSLVRLASDLVIHSKDRMDIRNAFFDADKGVVRRVRSITVYLPAQPPAYAVTVRHALLALLGNTDMQIGPWIDYLRFKGLIPMLILHLLRLIGPGRF